MVIAIDPGHNGGNAAHPAIVHKLVNAGNGVRKACNTTGTATNAGYPEHAFTFDVARRLAAVLRSRGATVVLTRSSDTGVGPCVNVRATIANRAHADALISIHADGNLSTGAHGFHVDPIDGDGGRGGSDRPQPATGAGNPGGVPRTDRSDLLDLHRRRDRAQPAAGHRHAEPGPDAGGHDRGREHAPDPGRRAAAVGRPSGSVRRGRSPTASRPSCWAPDRAGPAPHPYRCRRPPRSPFGRRDRTATAPPGPARRGPARSPATGYRRSTPRPRR